ncbi:23S rRNA (guanosine(2251)-2'-O)-methyltransferase RlmB [Ferruginibacter lapsinanis]|uniref:23S rRNA (guanosine(2251)-2'-O)-methyltransferase RlmB n=1 Tax=Ferruginibacter lapsinanis TaxID=563172 RepID=UPI001E41AEEE|nr:23S rRNA (guanosine(2251)-2'-O)-methyltransferase RlmB [Ferruginibacter lapsinanis]UEG49269.1 23S rRNA (guanosine(2251)-2'-O)-methyltransferase RlmB [Ferruginibacter lapsinanis]
MKNFRQQQHRPKKNTLIIGRKAIIEAMQSGKQLERIYLQATVHGEVIDEIRNLAEKNLVPINKVPVEKLNNFNVSNHEGCVAVISKIQYQNLQDIISFIVEKGEMPFFLILDGITDIRNIGGIARSAFCFGVNAIIIPDKGVGALNEDAILTSAGALEKIPVCRVSSLMKAVDELHLNGIKVFASEMTATKKVSEMNLQEPCAIVMGGEEHGVYPALMKICDDQFQIPMPGDFESLNVSVATGIILYEATRQRGII